MSAPTSTPTTPPASNAANPVNNISSQQHARPGHPGQPAHFGYPYQPFFPSTSATEPPPYMNSSVQSFFSAYSNVPSVQSLSGTSSSSSVAPSHPTSAMEPGSVKVMARPPALNSSVLPSASTSPSSSPTTSHANALQSALLSPQIPRPSAASTSAGLLPSSRALSTPFTPSSIHLTAPSSIQTPPSSSPGASMDAESKDARKEKQESALIGRLDKLFGRYFSKPSWEKSLLPVLTQSLEPALKTPLNDAFKTNFSTVLLPAFEASTRVMLKQISDVHSQMAGRQEKLLQERAEEIMKLHSQNLISAQSAKVATDPAEMEEMRTTLRKLAASHDALNRSYTVLSQQYNAQAAQLTELKSMLQSVQGSLSNLAATGGPMHAPAPPRGDAAPVAHPPPQQPLDPRPEITLLLTAGSYDAAFHKALSSGKLIVWLCRQVDPRVVFNSRALSPPMILSLIQQLGFSFQEDAQLKLMWLKEAAMAIQPNDPHIAAHVPVVIADVLRKLETQLSKPLNDTTDPLHDTVRLLRHLLIPYVMPRQG